MLWTSGNARGDQSLKFRSDAAATLTEERTMKPEGPQCRRVIVTRPVRKLNMLKEEMGETTEGDQTDGCVKREMRGDWGHLYGPECCSVCGQNLFECGCLSVSFESRREKQRREERERAVAWVQFEVCNHRILRERMWIQMRTTVCFVGNGAESNTCFKEGKCPRGGVGIPAQYQRSPWHYMLFSRASLCA